MTRYSFQGFLTVAGGAIKCARCTAKSKRTGQQCGRPALKCSTTVKCQFHGGRGSGPKTEAGRVRIGAANTVHGQETMEAKADRSRCSAQLSQIEDAMVILGITSSPRTRGRKALGYRRLRTLSDLQLYLRQVKGSGDLG